MRKYMMLLLAGLLAVNCGYHLRGTGSFLPTHIKRVNIPVFKNLTTRYELDTKLTRGVINEMVARGKVELTADTEGADAILTGEIVMFAVNPIAFSQQATADRYNITVVARIVMRDLVNQNVLFSNPSFIYVEEYEVPSGTNFEAMETEAIDKIAEKFGRQVVVNILEGF